MVIVFLINYFFYCSTLNIEKEVIAVWNILAAIYHLGIAGVSVNNDRVQFSNSSAATKASACLGVTIENLSSAAFDISSQRSKDDLLSAAWESLESLVSGLYSTTMSAVVSLINNKISTSTHTNMSIYLIDSPGKDKIKITLGLKILQTIIDFQASKIRLRVEK
jgi:myosin XVIII